MVIAIINRVIESFKISVIQFSNDWFILFRILFIVASLIVYGFSIIIILVLALFVIFIVTPMSYFYRLGKNHLSVF